MTQVATKERISTGQAQIWVALGSNWGDREGSLRRAAHELRRTAAADFRASSIWETPPIGVPFGGAFLNAVVGFLGEEDPWAWLKQLQRLEIIAGRRRSIRNGPRILDLDLLAVGGRRVRHPQLQLPHPRLHERAFVLEPWAEIEPGGRLPGNDLRVADQLQALDRAGIRRSGALLAAPESLPL